jgi:digeranylgeranylglycerophospholipid reductase
MKYDHDIIIVGAGPAGLHAGTYAAAAGADVLILDRKTELGKPVRCGEAAIENIFRDFNLKPEKGIVANRVNKLNCYSSKGKEISLEISIYGYILNREIFEQYLGTRAEAKGVKIQLESTVVGLKKNKLIVTKDNGRSTQSITGRIIIGADGVESRLGRWAGIDTTLKSENIAVCQQYVLEDLIVEPEAAEFYWGSKYSPHGYIWVFPKSDNKANVGIVGFGSKPQNLGKLLNRFISTRAPQSRKTGFIAGCVPQAEPLTRIVADNVILIGDAARVAIPVTGAGIGNALLTGKWAGEISGDIIANNLDIANLNKIELKMTKIRRKIAQAYKLKQKILRDDGFIDLLFGFSLPIKYFYKISPGFLNKFLLKNIRY